jgi:monoamine oxidase
MEVCCCKEFCKLSNNKYEKDPSSKHVIIIGAGIAGLRAAQIACENNLSYTVLEANDYIGGRVRCKEFCGC